MKLYTNQDQTAKLIELGFEKPKSIVGHDGYWGYDYAYSTGELIEILPRTIKSYYDLSVLSTSQGWGVLYGIIGDGDMWSIEYEVYRSELIDALYAMVVKLKEEGVI